MWSDFFLVSHSESKKMWLREMVGLHLLVLKGGSLREGWLGMLLWFFLFILTLFKGLHCGKSDSLKSCEISTKKTGSDLMLREGRKSAHVN